MPYENSHDPCTHKPIDLPLLQSRSQTELAYEGYALGYKVRPLRSHARSWDVRVVPAMIVILLYLSTSGPPDNPPCSYGGARK